MEKSLLMSTPPLEQFEYQAQKRLGDLHQCFTVGGYLLSDATFLDPYQKEFFAPINSTIHALSRLACSMRSDYNERLELRQSRTESLDRGWTAVRGHPDIPRASAAREWTRCQNHSRYVRRSLIQTGHLPYVCLMSRLQNADIPKRGNYICHDY